MSASSNALLLDLYGHQAWADAEHWRAIGAHQPARDDQVIRNRIHHIHVVQRAFLWVVGDRRTPFAMTQPADFKSFDDLNAYARTYHDEMQRFMESITDARLSEEITIPWVPKEGRSTLAVLEALTQAAMHSHYHRGQNATRLRELGGEPPTTDLIMWYWKGRPAPLWL
jgi:uncharacterized damage-inducible protein DinB